ncbi:MAG TPA: ABC transporter permease [Vicinamibacterales bacterium]|nr:ABC transporter permease [Vicinamibacterales bacterium]
MSVDLVWSDLRLAVRNACNRPGFTALLVLTLALGIGVNSAVFALLDGILLRPLPYRDPSRLVFLWQTLPAKNVMEVEPTPFDFSAWQSLRGVSELAIVKPDTFTLSGDDNPERLRGSRVTASLMPLLGIAPRLGRSFTPAEDLAGTGATAILSDRLWRRRFGADARVVGQTIQVDGEPRTIVGVMPRGASLPGPLAEDDDVWLPMRMTPDERVNESSHNYKILGRLRDGVTLAEASAELEAFAARMATERRSHGTMGARLVAVGEQTVHLIRPTLLLIAGSVGLLLLVASANAATLLLARASNRRHELAVRTALGATRGRLLSLAIAESLVYATLGGIAGLVLGGWALRMVLPLFAGSLPSAVPIDVDGRVAVFTTAISALLGILFGIVVAVHKSEGRLVDVLKSSGRTISGAGAGARGVLVIAQVALAVILLSAAGLMLNSVVKLSRVRPGFDPDHLLTFRIALTGSNYASAPSRVAFVFDLLDRLRTTPGVRHAAVNSAIPFGGSREGDAFSIEGRIRKPGELQIADQRQVSPNYFETMNIPLVKGRLFNASDDSRGEPVVIINRTMAKQYWPDEDPINRRVRTDPNTWLRIVGVVEDVHHVSLSRDPVTEMYRPIAQTAAPLFTMVVRTAGDPSALAPSARAAVQAIDPNLPIYEVRTMEDRIARSMAQTRGTVLLLLVTAMLAAALSGVAIYGSIWYSVSQRIPEIGVRLALGASRASVFVDVLRRAAQLTGVGAAIGVGGALAGGRFIAALLFDTRAADPTTLTAVVAATMVLALAASAVPARRAMSVDPMIALRTE